MSDNPLDARLAILYFKTVLFVTDISVQDHTTMFVDGTDEQVKKYLEGLGASPVETIVVMSLSDGLDDREKITTLLKAAGLEGVDLEADADVIEGQLRAFFEPLSPDVMPTRHGRPLTVDEVRAGIELAYKRGFKAGMDVGIVKMDNSNSDLDADISWAMAEASILRPE